MGTGSGLCGVVGIAEEATYGTNVTVDHFAEFLSESLSLEPTRVTSEGIRGCGRVQRSDRRVTPSRTAGGDVEMDVLSKGFGLWWKHMLGSAAVATQIGVTPLYRQIHTIGDLGGKSLTVQKHVPRATAAGTVDAYTYPGAKVSEWELSCESDGLLTLSVTLDARDELDDVAAAVASYAAAGAAELFHFAQLQVFIGGTVSTTDGLASVTGGTELGGRVRSVSLSGNNELAVDRFHAGSAGVKSEQLENGFRGLSGSLNCDYIDKTLYDEFRSDAGTPLRLVWTGQNDVGTSNFPRLEILYPAVHLDTGSPQIGSPEIVPQELDLVMLDDGVNAPVQIVYDSTDTTV